MYWTENKTKQEKVFNKNIISVTYKKKLHSTLEFCDPNSNFLDMLW